MCLYLPAAAWKISTGADKSSFNPKSLRVNSELLHHRGESDEFDSLEGPSKLLCSFHAVIFEECSLKMGADDALCLRLLSCCMGCSQEEAARRGVYSPQDLYTFPATHAGTSSTLKVNIRNNSSDMHEVRRAVCSCWAEAHTHTRSYRPDTRR